MESDEEFFARRAEEERAAAEAATKRSAKRAHLKLAEGYEAAVSRAQSEAENENQLAHAPILLRR